MRHIPQRLVLAISLLGVAALALSLSLSAFPAHVAQAHAAANSQSRSPAAKSFTPHYFPGRHTRAATASSSGPSPIPYQGGQVLVTPSIYINFWGIQWQTGFSTGGYTSAQAQQYVTDFLANVGGSSWLNTVTQYCQGAPVGALTCDSAGTFIQNPKDQLKGVWVDTTPLPNTINDQDIEQAALRADQHFGYDPNGVYYVFTPTGHSDYGFGKFWCAWHSSSTDAMGNELAYAYIPYSPDAPAYNGIPGGWCGANFVNPTNDSYGHGYFDGFSVNAGHELVEAITDPHYFGNASVQQGWDIKGGTEIGDNCSWVSTSANIRLPGGLYFAEQPIWSNESNACLMSS